jgi:succinyl-CoA synthetase beta subunit
MKIHEYQAKEVLRRHKVSVPFGVVIEKKEEGPKAFEEVSKHSPVVVVKAQIHAGGRGKGGGVKVTKSKEDALAAIDKILGMQLITHQTGPEGKKVLKVYLEQGIDIDKEFYISLLLDRSIKKTIVMASREGGMDIEEVAEKHPEKILKIEILNSNSSIPKFYFLITKSYKHENILENAHFILVGCISKLLECTKQHTGIRQRTNI